MKTIRAIGLGFLVGYGSGALAEDPVIAAPNSTATVPADKARGDARVIVDGWSCGVDIIEDAVATLAELSRRRAVLDRQVEAGTALAGTPAIRQEPNRDRRLRTFDDALAGVAASAPPEIRALTRREERDLKSFEGFRTLKTYRNSPTRFAPAGVTDEGLTEMFVLPDCFETIQIEALTAQIRNAATEVADRRDALRQIRDNVASGVGV